MPTERAASVVERVSTRHASGGSRRPAGVARYPADPAPAAAIRYPPEPSKNKRGREPKQTPDEHSSGQVFVPPKVPTQYRDGGGRVTIVDNQNQVQAGAIKTDPIKIGDPNTLWNIPNDPNIPSNVAPITR